MKQALRIDSSLFAGNGVSQQLAQELLHELELSYGPLKLVHRDLAAEGVPHLDSERVQALATPEQQRTVTQQQLVAESDGYLNELMAAELVIIGAPMYNFSVPSVLKAWFDHVARAGVSFAYTKNGPQGLLQNKTAYVITTRGGLHRDQLTDTEVPYIKNFLAFLGIHDVHFIYAEGLNMGEAQRERGLSAARETIQQLAIA